MLLEFINKQWHIERIITLHLSLFIEVYRRRKWVFQMQLTYNINYCRQIITTALLIWSELSLMHTTNVFTRFSYMIDDPCVFFFKLQTLGCSFYIPSYLSRFLHAAKGQSRSRVTLHCVCLPSIFVQAMAYE